MEVSDSPPTARQLVEILHHHQRTTTTTGFAEASTTTLVLEYGTEWSVPGVLDDLVQAAQRNTHVREVCVYASGLTVLQAQHVARVLEGLDAIEAFGIVGGGGGRQNPNEYPAISPDVTDCLLYGLMRSRSMGVQCVRLHCEAGSDAIREFCQRFTATLEVLEVRHLTSPVFAGGLSHGWLHARKLRDVTLHLVGSGLALLRLLPSLPALSHLERFVVLTRLVDVDLTAVLHCLQVFCQYSPALRHCTLDGAGTSVRHLLGGGVRLSTTLRELTLWDVTCESATDAARWVWPCNQTLQRLHIRGSMLEMQSLIPLGAFRGLMTLEVSGCRGEGLGSVNCWTALLEQLVKLQTLQIDLSQIGSEGNNVLSAISCFRREAQLSSVVVTLGEPEYPSLQKLVQRGCRSLKISATRWAKVNLSHLCHGIETNPGSLDTLSLDFETCDHTCDDFAGLFRAVKTHGKISEFELCLYQEEGHCVLDVASGSTLQALILADQLRHLRFRNWYGFSLSSGFVSHLSEGLQNAESLVCLDLGNCSLPDGSLRRLADALRITKAPLAELVVDLDNEPCMDVQHFYNVLPHLASLRSLRLTPVLLPPCSFAAGRLVEAVRCCPTLQSVHAAFPSHLQLEATQLQFYLRVHRWVREHGGPLKHLERLSPSLWPKILATLTMGTCENPQCRQLLIHLLYHHVLRPWPTLLTAGL